MILQRCHHGSRLLFVGITFLSSWYFLLLGGFCFGIQGIDKGIKKCVTLGSLNNQLGIYMLWEIHPLVWLIGPQYFTTASVFDHEYVSYFTRVSCTSRTLQNTWSVSFAIPLIPYIFVSIQTWTCFILRMSLVSRSNTTEHLKCVV